MGCVRMELAGRTHDTTHASVTRCRAGTIRIRKLSKPQVLTFSSMTTRTPTTGQHGKSIMRQQRMKHDLAAYSGASSTIFTYSSIDVSSVNALDQSRQALERLAVGERYKPMNVFTSVCAMTALALMTGPANHIPSVLTHLLMATYT